MLSLFDDLELVGGHAICAGSAPDSTKPPLDGAGGDARPGLTLRGYGNFRLRNLTITGGDQAGNDNGGGIYFEGGGILDIADTTITDNTANDGDGIHTIDTTILAEVVLGANVTISSNVARNGGCMVSKSLETSILGPRTTLTFNESAANPAAAAAGASPPSATSLRLTSTPARTVSAASVRSTPTKRSMAAVSRSSRAGARTSIPS